MRHCCTFEEFDVWKLFDNEKYKNRKLSFGICPICRKPVAELNQIEINSNKIVSMKKIGISSQEFVEHFKSEIEYSKSKINKMKFQSAPFGWIYGVNKEIYKKNSSKAEVKQYASDFYGNKILIKII